MERIVDEPNNQAALSYADFHFSEPLQAAAEGFKGAVPAPSSKKSFGQNRRWSRAKRGMPFDFSASRFERLWKAEGLTKIFLVLIDRQVTSSRDGTNVVVRIAEMEDLQVNCVLNSGDVDAGSPQAFALIRKRRLGSA